MPLAARAKLIVSLIRLRFVAPSLLAACLLLPARAADAAARYQAVIDAKGRDSASVRVQAKTENDIVVKVDRYIVWPGQALAYKLGELKLKELRALATKQLGAKFDVRVFHDEVLRHGSIPLDLLESNIRQWLATPTGTRTQ